MIFDFWNQWINVHSVDLRGTMDVFRRCFSQICWNQQKTVDFMLIRTTIYCNIFLLYHVGRSCLVCNFTSVVVHLECSNMLSENAGIRSTCALNTPTLFSVCFLQCSSSMSEITAHVFHISIDIGASRLVLPIAHILCWWSATINSTHLSGLTGTNGHFV